MTWLSIKPSELDIKARQLDGLFWSSIANKTHQIRRLLPRRVDKVAGGDIFNVLYQWNPELRDSPPDPALAAWLKQTMQSPKFKQLRAKTVGDRHVAAGATLALFRELMRPKNSPLKAVLELKHHLDRMEAIDASQQEEQQEQQQASEQEPSSPNPQDAGNMQGDGESNEPATSEQASNSNSGTSSGASSPSLAPSPAVQAIKQVQQTLAESFERDGLPEMNKYGRFSDTREGGSEQGQAIENTLADLEVTEELSAFDAGGNGSSLDN